MRANLFSLLYLIRHNDFAMPLPRCGTLLRRAFELELVEETASRVQPLKLTPKGVEVLKKRVIK